MIFPVGWTIYYSFINTIHNYYFYFDRKIKKVHNTNSNLLLYILCAFIEIFIRYIGINEALSLESDLSKVAPHILLNGIKTSLFTSSIGRIIMFIQTALWYLFINRHTLFVV